MSEPQDHSFNGTRFCSSCRSMRDVIGGTYKIWQNGRLRRWVCVECRQRAEERHDRVSIKKENENGQ
jgi:hypothetical protein